MNRIDATPDDRTVMAGSLALGLLEGPERAEALRLMLSDRDFANEVETWRQRTGDLFDALPEVEPPQDMWQAIERRIGAPSAPPRNWWRLGTIGASALAASLALALIWQPAPMSQPTGQVYAVSQLTGDIDGLRIAARYEPATATLHLRTIGMPDTPTAPELWIVPADGIPRSLGQIGRSGDTVIAVAKGHRSLINPQASFALSMEPKADQPHASPSAPMVARGKIDLI